VSIRVRLGLGAFLILGLTSCGVSGPTPPPARPPVPVVVATAQRQDLPLRLLAVGTASASESVVVRPQVSATLIAVRFTEGATVAAGDLLCELDSRPFAAAVAQAEADLARARAAARQAVAILERDRAGLVLAEAADRRTADLQRQDLASAQQQEQSRATVDQARATIAADEAAVAAGEAAVAAAEAQLDRARLDLSWCAITAPIAGRTGALGLTVGNLVAAGQTALVTIAHMQPMYVSFALPASDLPAVRAAQERGQLAVTVVPEGGGTAEAGVLAFIDNQIDPATATIRLRATCANAAERLWPNQQCQVQLLLGVEAQVVTVPETAVSTGQRGTLVWVVAADQTATPRPVEVARVDAGTAVISKGLEAGETVVVDGQVRLSKGVTVALPKADVVKP
jgi:multidrug efflux system membrane fusion protein